MSFFYDKINESFLHDIEFGWKLLFKGEWYTITGPTYTLDGDVFNVGVDAVLSFFVDMNGHYLQDEVEDKSRRPSDFFTELFEGTGYNYVLVDNLSANTLNYQANQSKTERFLYGIDRFNAEYKIQGKQAYIYGLAGSDKDVILHEDLNIQDVSIEVDASGFHTWAKGFGDKDESKEDADYELEVEYVSPLVEKYGYIEGPAIRDGSYKHKDALVEAVKKQVENSVKISTTVTAIDLTNNGYPEMQFEEGDRVWLYVTALKQNQQVRVVEIEETFDWEGNIIDAQYTLGNEGIAARYKSQQYNTLSDFRDIQNGKKTLEFNWLPEAIKRASDIINGNLDSHFEYHAGEIIGINKSNPNGYMRFNTDGIGFSRDGGKTYRSAMTYEGIVADAITVGTLRGILIEGVEIRGSTIVSRVSDTEYVTISGADIESRGSHTRTWFGETTTEDVGIQLRYGRLRFHNYGNERNLYFSDRGITTYIGGSDSEDEGYAGSGTIEFFSYRYSDQARGITMYSNRGHLALETDTRDIILNSARDIRLDPGNYIVVEKDHSLVSNSIRNKSSATNFYIGVSGSDDGEVRVTNKLFWQGSHSDTGYRPIRVSTVFAHKHINSNADQFLYLGSDLGVRVTSRNTNNNDPVIYRDVFASDFKQRSSKESKENIRKCSHSGLDKILGTEIVEFDYKKGQKNVLGALAEETSLSKDNEFISIPEVAWNNTLAIQEIYQILVDEEIIQ